MNLNKISLRLLKLFDLLVITSPIRTSLGALTGIVLYFLAKLYSPALRQAQYIDLASIDVWMCISIGVFVLHISTILRYIFSIQRFPPEIEAAFNALQELRLQHAPELEINTLCRKICDKILQSLDDPQNKDARTNRGKHNPDSGAAA